MSNQSNAQMNNWKETRKQGMWRYILIRGILAFGLILALVATIIDVFVFNQEFNIGRVAARTLIAGIVFGALMWSWNERQFKKQIDTEVGPT